MKSIFRHGCLAFMILLTGLGFPFERAVADILFKADFETGDFSQFNGLSKNIKPGHIEVVSDIVHSGKYAGRFSIHEDNVFNARQLRVQANGPKVTVKDGSDTFVSFYMFMKEPPKDRDNFFYWEGSPPPRYNNVMTWWLEPKEDGSGTLIKYGTGNLGRKGVHWVGEFTTGQWHQLGMNIHWSEDPAKGNIKLWWDGVVVLDKNVQTKGPESVYFSQPGIHRDPHTKSVDTIYFDDILCATTLEEIAIKSQATAKPKEPARNPPGFAKEVRPLLETYCFSCHSPTKRKGGLDLEKLGEEAEALELVDLWDQVNERVTGKEMPPAKSKQLSDDEREVLMAWVKHVAGSKVRCEDLTEEQRAKSLSGHTSTRRLNRGEYNNTLRDLFGVDLHAGDLLPSEGGGGEGFDNAGATLFITPVLMEKYLEAAEMVLSTILPAKTDDEEEPAEDKTQAAKLEEVRRQLLVATPGPSSTPRAAARTVLLNFLPRAFRRPATETEIERYLAVFDKAEKAGLSFDQAIKTAIKAILVAPSFLFLTETPPDKPGVYQLDHFEVATHLSYFLWATMPDGELTGLAAKGMLHDPKVLAGQVRRMMREPKARGLADGFAAQWLAIRALGETIRPDSKLFPEFTEELAAAMREETLLFFDAIVREDRSVLDILDARFTFVNEVLASHYKLEGVKGPQMRKVPLDDPKRGGVLGNASIMTVTSYPHRTSPVLRGRWILEELLGAEVPPPPPDVPVLNERDRKSKELSFRKRLEQHRAKAECATCHSRIDPLGFGFENFDPLGRWRTEQGTQPIDSAGKLPTGEEFNGPVELKKLLMTTRRPEFLRNLSRKMLGYALAREVNRVDLCVVDDCVDALEHNDYRISSLLETIVLSYPFSHRVHEE